ncbi:MAG: hypothetical protein ACKO9Q_21155, partial [Pirellula sp.]
MLSLERALCLIFFYWASQGSLFGQDDSRLQGQALKRGTDPVWADIKQEDVQYGARPLGRDDLESKDQWADDSTSGSFWSWLFGNGNSGASRTSTGTAGGSSGAWRGFWDWFFFL